MAEKLKANLNLILIILLMATIVVSYFVNQRRQEAESTVVSVPVVQVSPVPAGVAGFRAQRDETAQQDMAALQALCDEAELDAATRQDAAALLQRLIEQREKQSALEGALCETALAPCVAVVGEGSVTIVTEKPTLSDGETALVMTMAQAHAGVEPSGVRVITSQAAQ